MNIKVKWAAGILIISGELVHLCEESRILIITSSSLIFSAEDEG